MELRYTLKAITISQHIKKGDNMNKGIVATIAFIFGAGVGSYATYRAIKDRYAQIAQEEIDAIKELYSHKKSREDNFENVSDEQREAAEKARHKADVMEYAKILNNERYSQEETKPEDILSFEFIPESEFGDDEEYDRITLTYYADGVLTDDEDEIMDEYDNIVGNFEDHFTGDTDVVYVRNFERKAYYEIVRDSRTYAEVVGD